VREDNTLKSRVVDPVNGLVVVSSEELDGTA
jgi:hypothetical protein